MPHKKHMHGSAKDTEAAFYDAIGRADINALMALWAHDEEIVCVHPGAPRAIGHAAIRASWEAIFERGGVHIRAVQLHEMHNLMTAVHSVVEEIYQAEEGPRDLHIIATNVYIKTPQGWRIASHHSSVASGKTPTTVTSSAVLH